MTQRNLGAALAMVGAYEPGSARLEEAVRAYRLSLEVFTRERAPLEWALIQMQLATALTGLGEREPGTARLEEAVTAQRLALEEQTRDRNAFGWAGTVVTHGATLAILGRRETGVARLEEAAAACRLALASLTSDREPFLWGQAHYILALTLETIADRSALPPSDLGPALEHMSLAVDGLEAAGNSYWIEMAAGERDRIRKRIGAPVAASEGDRGMRASE